MFTHTTYRRIRCMDEVLQYRRVFNMWKRAAPFPLVEATRLVINICSRISVC